MVNQEGKSIVVRGVIGLGNKLLDQPGIHNGFLGISLDKQISNEDLKLYIQWAMEHSRHCPVLIDDYEFRHNYIVFRGMSEEGARDLAAQKGLELAKRAAGIIASEQFPYQEVPYLKTHPEDHRGHGLWVNRSSKDFGLGFIDSTLAHLVRAYEADGQFKQDVNAQVERALGKRMAAWRTGVAEDVYRAGCARLAKFVLEEAAITINYVEGGYSVEIYAGQPIQVVANLYGPKINRYPGLRETLNLHEQYGHISLGIERIKRQETGSL